MSKEINERMFQLCRETSAMLTELYISYNSYRKEWSGSYLEREMEEQFQFIHKKETMEGFGKILVEIDNARHALQKGKCDARNYLMDAMRNGVIGQQEYQSLVEVIGIFSNI